MEDLISRLKGEYDKHQAILSVYAGAGGTDAQDWAEMLLKMYLKFAAKEKWPAIHGVTGRAKADNMPTAATTLRMFVIIVSFSVPHDRPAHRRPVPK